MSPIPGLRRRMAAISVTAVLARIASVGDNKQMPAMTRKVPIWLTGPERQRSLAQRSRCGLALQTRRLPSPQEMVVVPRTLHSGTGAVAGGGVVFCRGSTADWGDSGSNKTKERETMSENDIKCPIWGTPARIERENSPHHRDGSYANSPRAGGAYFIAAGLHEGVVGGLEIKMRALDVGTKARLTSWLVEQRRLGEEWPEITDKTIEDAKHRRDLPISERSDRVLRYFRQIEPSVGRQFTIDVQDQKYRDTLMAIQAWSESKLSGELKTSHIQEMHFFIDYLGGVIS